MSGAAAEINAARPVDRPNGKESSSESWTPAKTLPGKAIS